MRANSRPSSSSNTNSAAFSPRATAATMKMIAISDLPVPAGPRISVLEPVLDAAAEQLVELGDAARQSGASKVAAIFRSHQPGKYVHPARGDGDVMIAAAESDAAIFDHADPPALGAVGGRQLLQPDHAMGDAVHGLVGDSAVRSSSSMTVVLNFAK